MQNFGFLAVALFSALILTSPLVTALTLLGFIVVSLLVSLFFERRAFCRYLCPIGGFVGVYGQVAPVAVRVKDPAVCQSHTEKTCFTGSDAGYGCPYFNLPQKLETNTLCSMCGECLRTCTKDNVAFYVQAARHRPAATRRGRRLDEAFNGLMMLAAAFVYSVVLIGPYGWLKATARAVGTPAWFVYAGVLLLFSLVLVPGLFWLCVRLGQRLAGKTAGASAARPSAEPVSAVCRLRDASGAAGAGDLGGLHAVVHPDQLLVCLARAFRPVRLGLEPVRHRGHDVDALPVGRDLRICRSGAAGRPGRGGGAGAAHRTPARAALAGRTAGQRLLRPGGGGAADPVHGMISMKRRNLIRYS